MKNELRIGNFISRLDLGSGTPRIEQILELLAKRAVTSGPCKVIVLYEDIKPILITEEWLLKFGFKHSGNGFYIHIPSLIEMYNIGDKYFYSGLKGVSIGNIKYIHQLQNLYHALTGFDLQIGNLTEH